MNQTKPPLEQEYKKRAMLFYGITGVLSAVYAVSLFFQPDQSVSAAFTLGENARKILRITFTVPIMLIWFLGTESILSSSFSAKKARSGAEKSLFRALSWGIGILLGGFVFGTFVGQLKSYFPDNESVRRMTTIIVNYTYVFPPLFGFWILSRAVNPAQRTATREREYNGMAVFLAFLVGTFWAALIFTNTGRQVSRGVGLPPSFYISDILIVATIILPTLLSWFYGIAAALRLSDFSAEITERGRERVLSRLVFGIQLLIFSYILLFGLLSLGSTRLIGLGLVGVIIALYLFIAALLAAHWLISASIKNLGAVTK